MYKMLVLNAKSFHSEEISQLIFYFIQQIMSLLYHNKEIRASERRRMEQSAMYTEKSLKFTWPRAQTVWSGRK